MAQNKPTEKAERLIPGTARVIVQQYRPGSRAYSMAAGMSNSGIQIASRAELKRLWAALDNVIQAAHWRDINQTSENQQQA